MKTSLGADHSFALASHENPLDPGVWKKVLFLKSDLQSGAVQMVNWARMGVGKRFAAHYHEDMQEIFVILQGEAHLQVGSECVVLCRGDAVRIDPREVHAMSNPGGEDVEYVVVGISSGMGRTVVVEPL
ncbi:MAG: cupin domain-containing protein [Pirellulaceae bacterium]|jgi:mannose-6-phosphate isomerase-like protein (cupin superfamily)|nr:cupin domain-containing protein [Pirellulaceae bacterium]